MSFGWCNCSTCRITSKRHPPCRERSLNSLQFYSDERRISRLYRPAQKDEFRMRNKQTGGTRFVPNLFNRQQEKSESPLTILLEARSKSVVPVAAKEVGMGEKRVHLKLKSPP
ncbi:hypothetical protein TNCV_2469442 [Trichonephila clavipes]|nr:hypothetical protein TNCV_2469442 [Trichonephila clavipes]